MITEKLQKAINEQITAEMWSANLYLNSTRPARLARKWKYGGLSRLKSLADSEGLDSRCVSIA